MGKGRILITGAMMRQLFQFPSDTIFHSGQLLDEVEVVVEHPDIPETPDGQDLPMLKPSFRTKPAVTVFDKWNPDTEEGGR